MLLSILIILLTEHVYSAQIEKIDPQDNIDSISFKSALTKELLKKKLLNLESARRQESLAQFLRKGENNLARGKSNFNVDDDPSRKQAQMANSFIASSNLLFGTKSQRRTCNNSSKSTSKEAVLDMQSLIHSFSGYNEEGIDFPSSKDIPTEVVRKRSFSKKGIQDPISCYLTEPKKVTCMHKDIIYKIQLPSSDVADDEIGRIVESIYKAVEGNRASNGKGTLDDSYKRKRASEDYIKSLFLNNLLLGRHPKTDLIPSYNGNNAVYLPLIIPLSQSKIDPAKAPLSYYSNLLVDPKLQVPYNLSMSGGGDALNGIGANGRNVLVSNGYGQYILPESYLMPASIMHQRSNNMTADEEKRRNWLALMATNGYAPADGGVDAKLASSAQLHLVDGAQSLLGGKGVHESNNKLNIAETSDMLNKRQERDTYYLKRQWRKKPLVSHNERQEYPVAGEEKYQQLYKMDQNIGDAAIENRVRGPQCPCLPRTCPPSPCPTTCTTKCTTPCPPKCPTLCPPKCPTPCPPKCPTPCPPKCPTPCPPKCPTPCPPKCPTPCPPKCPTPCPPKCPTPCPPKCPTTCPPKCPTTCPPKCPTTCSPKCSTTCSPKCTTSCPPKCPTPCPTPCPLPWPTRCPQPCPKPSHPPCQLSCAECPQPCNPPCHFPCPDCPKPCPTTCSTPCPHSCPMLPCPECDPSVISHDEPDYARKQQSIKSATDIENLQLIHNVNSLNAPYPQQINTLTQNEGINIEGSNPNGIFGKPVSDLERDSLSINSSEAIELKSKKHGDSFFSRLRSKFHKGLLTNGTWSPNNPFENRTQNKFSLVRPIITFNQGPPGMVWHASQDLSVSPDLKKHAANTAAPPQQISETPTDMTRYINQPNLPNQPMIPITLPALQPSQDSGYQTPPPINHTHPPENPNPPPLSPQRQPQPPGNPPQPPGSQPQQPENQPRPPVCQSKPPVSQPQPTVSQPQPTVSQPQPPMCQSQPPVCQPQPPVCPPQPPVCQSQPPLCQPKPPVCQSQPPVSQPQPPCQTQPPPCQPQTPSCQPQTSVCQPQPSKNQTQPPNNLTTKSTTQTQYQTTHKTPVYAHSSPTQPTPQPSVNHTHPPENPNPPPLSPQQQPQPPGNQSQQPENQTRPPVCQSKPIPLQYRRTSNNQNLPSNMAPQTSAQRVDEPLDSEIKHPSESLMFHPPQPKLEYVKSLQAESNQLAEQVQNSSQTVGRLQENMWLLPNEENVWWPPPQTNWPPAINQGNSANQPYVNSAQINVQTEQLQNRSQAPERIQEKMWVSPGGENRWWPPKQMNRPLTWTQEQPANQPSASNAQIRIQPNVNTFWHNVVHRIENPYRHVNRLPRTSFKWGRRHRANVKSSNVHKMSSKGPRGARKIIRPVNPSLIHDKIARIRRYLQSREKRRGQ